MIWSPRASVSRLVKEIPSGSSLPIGAKLALGGRCEERVAMNPELFVRIKAEGEPVDDFLSLRIGRVGDLLDCFLSPRGRLDRNFPSYETCKGRDRGRDIRSYHWCSFMIKRTPRRYRSDGWTAL